ncbi:MAG: hypothetical protein HY712_04370 [candidate division NC10 bacterium]|nr:hypothetical protein [candidate division NC10 bacterium]
MSAPTDPPAGLVPVPLAKGCVLLLTTAEFAAGIRRGKWWRRRMALLKREGQKPTPDVAPGSAITREAISRSGGPFTLARLASGKAEARAMRGIRELTCPADRPAVWRGDPEELLGHVLDVWAARRELGCSPEVVARMTAYFVSALCPACENPPITETVVEMAP